MQWRRQNFAPGGARAHGFRSSWWQSSRSESHLASDLQNLRAFANSRGPRAPCLAMPRMVWHCTGQHCSSMYACTYRLPVCGAPLWVLLQHSIMLRLFLSFSMVSCAFSALCVYSKFGHHPHPLGYVCAKFSFFRDLHCWARPWRKIAYSFTHPAYLMPQEPKLALRNSLSQTKGHSAKLHKQLLLLSGAILVCFRVALLKKLCMTCYIHYIYTYTAVENQLCESSVFMCKSKFTLAFRGIIPISLFWHCRRHI